MQFRDIHTKLMLTVMQTVVNVRTQTTISLRQSIVTFDSTTLPALAEVKLSFCYRNSSIGCLNVNDMACTNCEVRKHVDASEFSPLNGCKGMSEYLFYIN